MSANFQEANEPRHVELDRELYCKVMGALLRMGLYSQPMETFWSKKFDFGTPDFHLRGHLSLYDFKKFMQYLVLPGCEQDDESYDWIPEEWETL